MARRRCPSPVARKVADKMIRFLIITLLLTLLPFRGLCAPSGYAVARIPTPVFNTPAIPKLLSMRDGRLPTDRCGQLRELEFIALPGTVFAVTATIPNGKGSILRVTTRDYPDSEKTSCYLDNRFVELADTRPAERARTVPDRATILTRLRSAVGTRYVWGGNVRTGISEMTDYYPVENGGNSSGQSISPLKLAGLDCSGLLYETTEGFTPRNTGELIRFGDSVRIAGDRIDVIVRKLQPLDLIVWPGHVLIVLENGDVIESRLFCDGRKDGVVISRLRDRLADIMASRKPVNAAGDTSDKRDKWFVVRRWLPAAGPWHGR